MGRVAVFKIRLDDSKQEFVVSLQIYSERGLPRLNVENAKLPAYPLEIKSYYSMWQDSFRGLRLRGDEDDDWQVNLNMTTQRSNSEDPEACRKYVKLLEEKLENWLQRYEDRKWLEIRENLVKELAQYSDNMRLVIKADPDLWKLPWHKWSLLASYGDIGISYSLPDYAVEEVKPEKFATNKVRILAVLGDSKNINLQPDREAIASLEGAAPEFMFQPKAEEFIDKLRDPKGWDILFFAGHSQTKDKTGKIYISENENLQVDQFQNSIEEAIKKGLKIAILNSCEGSGLVQEIAKKKLCTAIFMQEKVPDRVAQFFLKEFLTEYSQGKPLHTAFSRAQARLEKFTDMPGVTWLPKLYQNPGEIPPTWQELCNPKKNETEKIEQFPVPKRPSLVTTIVASVLVTAAVVGMRSLGYLQSWELQAYDHLMQQRPAESPDSRLLIIGADEEDIRRYRHPLPDAIIAQVLDKIGQHQPQVIGLDIYRDLPVEPGHTAMVAHLQNNQKLITMCKFISDKQGINPPPKIPGERIGFNNLLFDIPDYKVRRYLLSRSPNPISNFDLCKTSYSFSFDLAFRYLSAKRIPIQTTRKQDWLVGEIIFKRLNTHSGGYQNIDTRGNQVLLNYRATPQIAQKVTVRDILSNRFDPSWLKGKVVLIAMTAESVPDFYNTPYGRMRGVDVHAHMVSEIISAVEDKRPLIWWLPLWGDAILVWLWSFAGGILILFVRSPLYLCLGISICLAILYGLCLGFFLQGGWLPLIPAGLALLTTEISLIVYSSWKTQSN